MKALCNKAMVYGHKKCHKNCHKKCHKKKRASLFPGREINIFHKSLEVIGSSKEGITIEIETTTLEDDNEYLVCNILKSRLIR